MTDSYDTHSSTVETHRGWAGWELNEALGYDPDLATAVDRAQFDTRMRVAELAARLAQVDALERIAGTFDQVLNELRSQRRAGGPS
ncbi:hypothetical protein [Nonomuraea sp. NPDC050540]|uniref:hypothetical protein n=1 Tax=Nonomuraea sp. NPDC050540 TaxID=3364367 RepID=UPI0037A01371